MTRALVIGYGSIGQRHARLLDEINCEVALVTRLENTDYPSFSELRDALDVADPEYVVVANETVRHADTIGKLASEGFSGKLLIEKPLTHSPCSLPTDVFEQCAVGYNLRFHPVLTALRTLLQHNPPVTINARCGQHLSQWRPTRNYKETYSASQAAGGGVLRDLSHELDYLLWLGGPWQRVASLGGNYGVLGIDADEAWSILLELEECSVAGLQLNYLDQSARRDIVINTRASTLHADLIGGTLKQDGYTEQFACSADDTYKLMHQAMLKGDTSCHCSVNEGAAVVDLVAAVETAAKEHRWIGP